MDAERTKDTVTLPMDVIREIFEFAARGAPDLALTLLLVSPESCEWISALLYRTIIMSREEIQPKGFPHACNNKLVDLYAPKVRHILLDSDGTQHQESGHFIISNLHKFTNAAHISIRSEKAISIESLSIIHPPHLSLSATAILKLVHPTERTLPSVSAFLNMTHLQILAWTFTFPNPKRWESWQGLADLPQLTHLAFPYDNSQFKGDYFRQDLMPGALKNCKKLRVFMFRITWMNHSLQGDPCRLYTDDKDPTVHPDHRVVVFVCSYVGEWLHGVRGGKNAWDMAEEVVAARESHKSGL
ncbi:hypothetical protein BDN72DRAFT_959540 [Pluteus cervinus]|uniref:Uncharacterized protein n=1 Tax=Pluteus cervinus TaxID=181527 RepID=A0ACD3AVU3_9AGAR|nr:hypothetical protein BDN72DRAFT_959540 [Pluteus cervinus]